MPSLGQRAPLTGPDTPLMRIGRALPPVAIGSFAALAPLPLAPLPRDPSDASLWLPGQGQANSCGTTTLAYVLRYQRGEGAPTRPEIDARIRRGDIFTAPPLLVEYARGLGLAARAYNGASLDLVKYLVDRQIPVMVLTDTTPLNLRDTANLHWVAVVSHGEGRIGVYNPHGFQEELDQASFEAHWREARIFGLPAWRQFAIAISRDWSALPPPTRPRISWYGADLASSGVAGIVNGAIGLRQQIRPTDARPSVGDGLRDLGGLLLGTAQSLAGGALLLAGAAAEQLNRRGASG